LCFIVSRLSQFCNKILIKFKKKSQKWVDKAGKLCYPKCGTCKKALKWLDDNGIKYEYRHIVEENPTKDELKNWYEKSGLPLKKFFNTSGLKYKELNLKDRIPQMTEEEIFDLLSTDGMLVKRPILISGDKVLVGFKEEEWSEKV